MNLEDALNQHAIDKKRVYIDLIARASKDLDLLNAVVEKAFTGIYSMSIAYRMVKRYPELAQELEQSILVIMEDCNAGLKSRGRRVQADLRALGLI